MVPPLALSLADVRERRGGEKALSLSFRPCLAQQLARRAPSEMMCTIWSLSLRPAASSSSRVSASSATTSVECARGG